MFVSAAKAISITFVHTLLKIDKRGEKKYSFRLNI